MQIRPHFSIQRRKLDGFFPTYILSQSITPATSVLNPRVMFDENFNFKQHVSLLFLPYPRSLLYSPVYLTFHNQNHCNSSSKQQTWLLQLPPLQFCKQEYSKTSTCPKLFGMGSHAFYSFFLLSADSEINRVHYRIIFKICTITYQALSSTQPAYLNLMLTPARHSTQLRSVSSNRLYNPLVKTKAGTRAFSVAAPTLWNSLPASVKLEV